MLFILFLLILVTPGFALLLNESLNAASRTSAMIMKQAEVCPYVSLCTKTNSSVYKKNGNTVPCCQECSCNNTCLSHGTCCPDFYIDDDNKNLVMTKEQSRNISGERKACVKTKHGNVPNANGYVMITSCPDNYENDIIKYNCESTLDILSTGSLLHHIPVSDIDSGLTYKNHYCEKCNKDGNTSTIPWDVWLECGAANFLFPYYLVGGPFEFAVKFISKDNPKDCNVAFTPSTANTDTLLGLQSCNVDTLIDTCIDAYHGSEIEKLCHSYSWAVKVRNGAVTYRNYACMLCNGQEFQERCYSLVKPFAVSLMVEKDKKDHVDTEGSAQEYTSQIIARPFAVEAGYVYCREGFVYDHKKGRCRHVLCPLYFFVKKGKCVPMFGLMKGIFYKVGVEILVPDSLKHVQQEDIEMGILDSLNHFLSGRLGEKKFEFYLWSSQSVSGRLNIAQPYLIALVIAGNVYGGKYAPVLEFVNNFVLRDKRLIVSLETGGKITNETLGIRFSSSINWREVKPFGRERFRLAKSSTAKTGKIGIDNATEVHISEISLCYRVLLKDNEFRRRTTAFIQVFETNNFLAFPSFSAYLKNDGEILTSSCVNKALNKIPDCSNNVFLNAKTCRYKYMTIPKVNDQSKDDNNYGLDDLPDDTHAGSSSERSIFVTLCTIGVLVLIIGTRFIIGRFLRRNDHPSEASPELDIELDVIPT